MASSPSSRISTCSVRDLASRSERFDFPPVLAHSQVVEHFAGQSERRVGEGTPETLGEQRPHPVVHEEVAAVEAELVGDRFHERERVLAVAPRPNVGNPRLVGYLLAVHVGDDENGVVVLRDEEEQVSFAGMFPEAGEVKQVRAREKDEGIGVGRIQSLLTPAGSFRESVRHVPDIGTRSVKVGAPGQSRTGSFRWKRE